MGPRHRCRGDPNTGAVGVGISLASMGPRHRCRGDRGMPMPDCRMPLSFNGATASLPWRRLSAALDRRPAARFNGATASLPWRPDERGRLLRRWSLLQWGHGIAAVETADFIRASLQLVE